MKNNKLYFILIFILSQIGISAQNVKHKDHYDYLAREEKGDLNHDGKLDKITVKMDTINEARPFRAQIFLSQPNGKLALAVTSDQMIEPQYPVENQGKFNGYQIPTFFIEERILSL